ncbi:MAG TPA: isochorismate synthase [Actinomycetota bacterium]|nr:isochorismate synthase [Actinomycetota bacterium]
MTSTEDPGAEVPPGSERPEPGPLSSRVVGLGDGLEPLDLAGEDGFAWRSVAVSLVGAGTAARIPVGTGPGRIERAAEAVAGLLGAARVEDPERSGLGPAAVGALPFSPASPGRLVVPSLLLRTGPDGRTWAVLTGPGPLDPPPAADLLARLRATAAAGDRPWPAARRLDGPGGRWTTDPPSSAVGLAAWRGAVLAALAAIGTGRLDKVVLAREAAVEGERPFPRAELLRRLRRRSGGSTFLYASGGFVGASPELLVRRQGRVAISRPMAGTVPRGDSAAAEADGLARLTGSAKEAVEHRLVVDAVAEGLAKAADRVEVGRPEVVRLTTVAHLATEITAELTGPLPTALELAGLLHPTPAVGGSPRDAALAATAAREPFDRGCYAGPVGWVDRAGDGEWAVALRGASLDGRHARLLAGAGIVPGSDPDAEWAETEHKLRAMLEVLLSR